MKLCVFALLIIRMVLLHTMLVWIRRLEEVLDSSIPTPPPKISDKCPFITLVIL